jgi:hypothetical protein
MKFKRLLPYLLLNILISAATTLGVLWFWEQAHPEEPTQARTSAGTPTEAPAPLAALPTLPASDETVVEIVSVFGAGDVQTEAVQIRRVGQGQLSLTGWSLQDANGNEFIFPNVNLQANGSQVDIYTRPGTNTVNQLYWGQTGSIWQSGEEAKLYDYEGNIRSTFQIP